MFLPRGNGTYLVKLPDETRSALVNLAEQLDEVLTTDLPQTKRLFPTAYPDDPERDAGYQVLARSELIERRQEAIALLIATADKTRLDEDELVAWMGVVNDVRLVLGTTLDVSEDDDIVDPDDPLADLYLLYHQLGALVHNMVMALESSLPEPDDDADVTPAGDDGP